jgi:hypothetical protein
MAAPLLGVDSPFDSSNKSSVLFEFETPLLAFRKLSLRSLHRDCRGEGRNHGASRPLSG